MKVTAENAVSAWTRICLCLICALCILSFNGYVRAAEPDGQGASDLVCEARDRCMAFARIVNSRTISELKENYGQACHAYPERAMYALRRYQIAPSKRNEAGLLETMPRGMADFAALYWVSSDGSAEDQGDTEYLYGAFAPDDQLPANDAGCSVAPTMVTRKAFEAYFSSIAEGIAQHPRYMPMFFAISQFFGHRDDPKDYGLSRNAKLRKFFSDLLSNLYKAQPGAFRRYANMTKYGKEALRDASVVSERR